MSYSGKIFTIQNHSINHSPNDKPNKKWRINKISNVFSISIRTYRD